MVQSRLQMYQSAIAVAKGKGDSSKVRRYERSVKTLNEMTKSLKAGKKINIDEIPPEVFVSGEGVASTKAPPTTKVAKVDDMDELKSWIASDDRSCIHVHV